MTFLNKIIIVLLFLVTHAVSAAEISVIVNSTNSDAIDAKLIKRIYLGKTKSFANGTKANVLSLSDSISATEEFRQKALSKSTSQFKSYWSKLAFTGKGTPPKEIASEAAMIDAVKNDASAIGFVTSANVTGDVKVIATF
ncbi:phosphate ABC transporter substrate-binding protein [Thalassotalea euphylliae]|uniref:phosphate ABC transporter substrate-binding protein n=1 Tax=Thalassotalea euphylliae TaxID=1655234 RepID=UPI0036281202